MVSRLLLMKMMLCNRLQAIKKRKRKSSDDGTLPGDIKTEDSLNDSEVSSSSSIQDTSLTCRICLKEGDIPIFGDGLSDDISEALISFGNVNITQDDTYPKYICTSCHSLLQGAIVFRKTAEKSDEILRKPKKEFPDFNTEDDILQSFEDTNTFDLDENTESEKKYHCAKCDVEFNSLKEINKHRKTTNHKNMKYECPICNKVYSMQYFKRHLLYHKKETPYVCDVCGKAFVMQGHFSRHRLTHDYELPFQCQLCPYRGRFSESLKMHMRRHTGEKPYQCPECPVRCINKSNLSRHMFTHKKEHDFRCDSCGKGFFTKRDLELHIKVDHAGIKEHICNICGKAFGYRKQMMKHQLKVHKREKLQNGRMPLYLQLERKQQMGGVV